MNFKHTLTAVAAALSLAGGAAQAATLSIVPSSTSVAVGAGVTVDLVLSGLDAIGQVVTGYDLNIAYNAALLSWASISHVGPLGDANVPEVVYGFDGTDGLAGGDATSFLSDAELDVLQGDSMVLMRFSFVGLTDGATTLSFGADPDFQRLVTGRLDQFGIAQVLDLTYQGTCIAVGTGDCNNRVPEPESYGLAAIALLGAGLARRRQVAKKA